MALNLADIVTIKTMREAGMNVDDIAFAMDVSTKTVDRVLKGETGGKQREIADRMEYFFPERGSGNYHNGEEMTEFSDPTSENVEFFEEMELFLKKLEENS